MNPQIQHPADPPSEHGPEPEAGARPPGFWASKTGLVTIAFLAIAAFFLLSEHRAHAFGYLPFLLLLACPVLHMFMHRGHGGHGRHIQQTGPEPGAQNGSKHEKGA